MRLFRLPANKKRICNIINLITRTGLQYKVIKGIIVGNHVKMRSRPSVTFTRLLIGVYIQTFAGSRSSFCLNTKKKEKSRTIVELMKASNDFLKL